jgi:anti-sigma regulatory factor (Ser/Thr protein kinase)
MPPPGETAPPEPPWPAGGAWAAALRRQRRVSAETRRWPLRSQLDLGALPSAVPCARLHARLITWEWGLAPLAEAVELVVSEIVTNAVLASASPAGDRALARACGVPVVQLRLATDRQRVLVQVWDGSPSMPRRQQPGPGLESGRGLLLVEALSVGWGTHVPPGSDGKTVWCVIADPG